MGKHAKPLSGVQADKPLDNALQREMRRMFPETAPRHAVCHHPIKSGSHCLDCGKKVR